MNLGGGSVERRDCACDRRRCEHGPVAVMQGGCEGQRCAAGLTEEAANSTGFSKGIGIPKQLIVLPVKRSGAVKSNAPAF